MCAVADHLDVVARLHPEGDGAPFDVDDLRRRGDTKADRRRRNVADVELDAEALMAERQQMLDRRERRRLDEVDHDRRCQHRDPAGTDEWCGMFRRHPYLMGAGETRFDAGEDAGNLRCFSHYDAICMRAMSLTFHPSAPCSMLTLRPCKEWLP